MNPLTTIQHLLARLLARADKVWRGARLSEVALGKYIILYGSILHAGWAMLLLANESAAGSTPLHIIVQLCGGRWRTAAVLLATSIAAAVWVFMRRRAGAAALPLMLIPQQLFLLMSAGAGVYAAAVQHYADGEFRSWYFILSDQLPVILAAILYTAAVLEAAFEPPDRVIATREEMDRIRANGDEDEV